jgi:hypothetical protein
VAASAFHVNVLEAKVLGLVPEPVVTVSLACVQPVVEIAGKVAEAGPEMPSVTAALKVIDPAAAART